MSILPRSSDWQPPESIGREDILARSAVILAKPDLPMRQSEDIFRIHALGLEWDLGVTTYEPADPAQISRGADGKQIGIFLLHGGSGDYKSMEPMAKLFAAKLGCKSVAMTFPGRLYLDDRSRDWPGDTINPDGSVRTPIWLAGEHIGAIMRWSATPPCGFATAPARSPAPSRERDSTIAWRPGRWLSRRA